MVRGLNQTFICPGLWGIRKELIICAFFKLHSDDLKIESFIDVAIEY